MISKKKIHKILTTSLTLFLLTNSNTLIFSTDLVSPSYKMLDPTVNSSTALGSSTTYSARVSVGDFGTDPLLTSPSYKLNGNEINRFNANVPRIACLENNSNGSSACTTASAFINTGGLVRACGSPGCYDRARIEISPENNPIDTLYGIQISSDSNFATFQYISGTTNQPIPANTRTIADYKTKVDWESIDLNILGLKSNTQYYFRVSALHGDLTESSPSPVSTITTSQLSLSLDLTLADITEAIIPSDQRNMDFPLPAGIVKKADNLIWINTSSNVVPGINIYTKGTYGGLYDGAIVTIPSASIDISTVNEGFGLQLYQATQWYDNANTGGHGQGSLGVITAENPYIQTFGGATENVGIVPQTPTLEKMLSTNGPVYNGKSGMFVVAKADPTKTYMTRISEEITIIMTANY